MHEVAPKPPTEDELLWRRCTAVQVAMALDSSEGPLIERVARVRRALFVRWLAQTGRLHEPIS